MVSVITAWGVRWTGLPHSPKTDSDRLMKDLRPLKRQRERKKGGDAGDRTQGLRLEPPALCHWATTNCLSLDDHYRSPDCGIVPSIGLPILWLHSPSIMINNCTQQSSILFSVHIVYIRTYWILGHIRTYIVENKRRLTSVASLLCWIATVLKGLLENTTPHQQHWANSVQKSPRQPLVRDWLATPETLMMLNRHCSKYRGRFVQGWKNTLKRLG